MRGCSDMEDTTGVTRGGPIQIRARMDCSTQPRRYLPRCSYFTAVGALR